MSLELNNKILNTMKDLMWSSGYYKFNQPYRMWEHVKDQFVVSNQLNYISGQLTSPTHVIHPPAYYVPVYFSPPAT